MGFGRYDTDIMFHNNVTNNVEPYQKPINSDIIRILREFEQLVRDEQEVERRLHVLDVAE